MAVTPQLFHEEGTPPRVYALPPGVDFPAELAAGLATRLSGQPPEAIARVELIVNTTRMRRRLRMIYAQRGPCFLPRIRLLTELGVNAGQPAPSKLARRLEISQLVRRLIQQEQTLAPRAAVFDLAASLQKLLDEVEGEGVPLHVIADTDVGHLSAHWARTLKFINIIAPFLSGEENPGPEAQHRNRVLSLIASWVQHPPRHPVILAGSTGSRGTTAALMEAVALLPQGAVVLPGYDFDQPSAIWDALQNPLKGEDHPQYRFAKTLKALDLDPCTLPRWTQARPPAPERNAVLSLALRPAPVTDQWLTEGPRLENLPDACAGLTLIEAPSARQEAQAIALTLRNAAEAGKTAALVTPDRVLARQVTAALDRWRIVPDDSAGKPLALSPPGRLLRQVALALGTSMRADALIALLKHPLTHSAPGTRGPHLLLTRDLELHLRKTRVSQPDPDAIKAWAAARSQPEARAWGAWLASVLVDLTSVCSGPLAELLAQHRAVTETVAAGPDRSAQSGLWDLAAGEETLKVLDGLAEAAPFGGAVTLAEYVTLLDTLLAESEVRDPARSHPNVMIWGTLEARVQGADLAILAGLNDGTWPPLPAADPWMNRAMRAQAGLLLPERQIGLSAHDFQQAIGAREVILSRAIRGDEAETVPSRWLNRLTNLLSGLSDASASELAQMRARGDAVLAQAARLDLPASPVPAAPRPAPRPPENARPSQLPVTRIETLVRDPYAVYARSILRLRPLPLLGQDPDARDRGSVFHKVMEVFVPGVLKGTHTADAATLEAITGDIVKQTDFPGAITAFWRAHMRRIAPDVVMREGPRLARAVQILSEQDGTRTTADGFTLTCRADRLDICHDGQLRIYDYKSTPPSKSQLKVFDFQLHLEAAIAAGGGIAALGPQRVAEMAYISLSTSAPDLEIPFDTAEADAIWDQFGGLITHWRSRGAGYTARRMMKNTHDASDYDHLSRHGEWEITDPAQPEDVG
ncbi:double-strand break repair protein AddB [Tropicimonas sp. S265A]|uniref:double-strand break repair protein AddB n=1 Tax=Tropicimonas sp. S265A TaxID=3415134 RepID=UPI003C7DF03E